MKKKRLNNKEKKQNQIIKKKLQEEGILPPDKPRLNRKKFAIETQEEFKKSLEKNDIYYNYFALLQCLSLLTPSIYENGTCAKITAEEVGALKVMKMFTEKIKFIEEKRSMGITSWTVGEEYEAYVKKIMSL